MKFSVDIIPEERQYYYDEDQLLPKISYFKIIVEFEIMSGVDEIRVLDLAKKFKWELNLRDLHQLGSDMTMTYYVSKIAFSADEVRSYAISFCDALKTLTTNSDSISKTTDCIFREVIDTPHLVIKSRAL